jgi:hypothetical protein
MFRRLEKDDEKSDSTADAPGAALAATNGSIGTTDEHR